MFVPCKIWHIMAEKLTAVLSQIIKIHMLQYINIIMNVCLKNIQSFIKDARSVS